MRCPSCGVAVAPAATVCDYCGSVLGGEPSVQSEPVFEQLKATAVYQEAVADMALPPTPSALPRQVVLAGWRALSAVAVLVVVAILAILFGAPVLFVPFMLLAWLLLLAWASAGNGPGTGSPAIPCPS